MNFLQTLEKYKSEGWLMNQVHPELPLTIWNYTQQTQYNQHWDEITLMCRGLVTDDSGNIVARPFEKFFNMEEAKHKATKDFQVFEKMDGSLGILFNYNGWWIPASRGSFTSEQCWKFKEILETKDISVLDKGYTYLFEIIYPENRIVVNYGSDEKIVMLGAVNTETAEEMTYDELCERYAFSYEIVERYNGISDFNVLKEKVKDNQEGFVVLFSNGDRMKIKGEEYCRLHSILTEISTKSVWKCLSEGDGIETILDNVPDEFFKKIKDYSELLTKEYNKLERSHKNSYNLLMRYVKSKKDLALAIKDFPRSEKAVLFNMYDGKEYSSLIWNMIKPEFRKL